MGKFKEGDKVNIAGVESVGTITKVRGYDVEFYGPSYEITNMNFQEEDLTPHETVDDVINQNFAASVSEEA